MVFCTGFSGVMVTVVLPCDPGGFVCGVVVVIFPPVVVVVDPPSVVVVIGPGSAVVVVVVVVVMTVTFCSLSVAVQV